MYIEPNSTIKIYRSIPLDPSYSNTLYFNSIAEQNNFFHGEGIAKFTLNAQTYQRVERGRMRVEIPADSLYDCNYLAFKNTSYGQKWFYAFITGIEYLNNQVSEITFTIDKMQTYICDMILTHCFVEREHSITDNIGDNILPEPVDVGEYVNTEFGILGGMITDLGVIISIVDTSLTYEGGTLYDNIYGGSVLFAYDANDYESIDAKVKEYIQAPEAIISMYMFPKFLLPVIPEDHRLHSLSHSAWLGLRDPSWNVNNQGSIDGHVVRNKKLYTYPYNYFSINNANGSSLALRYEKFVDLQPAVRIDGTIKEPVTVILRPANYKGSPLIDDLQGWIPLTTESIELNGYPLCSWNIDSYKTWVAQNSIPMVINGMSMLAGLALPRTNSLARYDSTKSAINGVASVLVEQYNASIKADICRGSTNSSNVNVASNTQTFWKSRTHIDKEHAEVIDSFFDVYGYATNKTKVPNINSRPHWNYVKTRGCIIRGNIPADEITAMQDIFNNGITFWKNASEVGNYSLNNSPE